MIELFPLKQPKFLHQFGIAALPESESIFKMLNNATREIEVRNRLLDSKFRDQYLVEIPDTNRIAEPIVRWAAENSEHLTWATDRLVNRHAETSCPRSHLDANGALLEWMYRNIQEDFVVLSDQPPYKLAGGCVCFPSGWTIREKVGEPLLNIHESVPEFQACLWNPTEKLLERIKFDKPVARSNWGIRPSGELDQSPRHARRLDDLRKQVGHHNALDACYFRVEFQTLTRIPNIGIVFTIRTTQCPLSRLTNKQMTILLGTLETCPDATLQYKGIEPMLQPILAAIKSKLGLCG